MPQSKNIARLSEDMKRELIAIIGQMKDPRLKTGLLTVMRIELAPDLSFAKVFISVLGTRPDAPQQAVAVLNRAAGHVRSEVAKRMHIRKTPEFRFVADGGAAYAQHINELIEGL
jgi:ribosome-binding factor A